MRTDGNAKRKIDEARDKRNEGRKRRNPTTLVRNKRRTNPTSKLVDLRTGLVLVPHNSYTFDSVTSVLRSACDRLRQKPESAVYSKAACYSPCLSPRIQGVSDRSFANCLQLLRVRNGSIRFRDPQIYRHPHISLERTRHDRECTTSECTGNIGTRGMTHGAWLSQADVSLWPQICDNVRLLDGNPTHILTSHSAVDLCIRPRPLA